jgi:GxxExxY protein
MKTQNNYFSELSRQVIGCAIEVHRHLGAGLLESTYEACLAKELLDNGLVYQKQLELPVYYKGNKIDCG